jgi:hypothetical protein
VGLTFAGSGAGAGVGAGIGHGIKHISDKIKDKFSKPKVEKSRWDQLMDHYFGKAGPYIQGKMSPFGITGKLKGGKQDDGNGGFSSKLKMPTASEKAIAHEKAVNEYSKQQSDHMNAPRLQERAKQYQKNKEINKGVVSKVIGAVVAPALIAGAGSAVQARTNKEMPKETTQKRMTVPPPKMITEEEARQKGWDWGKVQHLNSHRQAAWEACEGKVPCSGTFTGFGTPGVKKVSK